MVKDIFDREIYGDALVNIYINDNIEAWSYEHHGDICVVKENCVMESLGLFDYVNNTKKYEQILKLSSVILIGA